VAASYRSLPKKTVDRHIRTSKNYEYVRESKDLEKRFTNQFIVVAKCKVVHHTNDYWNFLKYLSEHREQDDLIGVRVRPRDKMLLL